MKIHTEFRPDQIDQEVFIAPGATVLGDVMIGMRAVVLNGAVIGNGSLVAAGALVTEGMEVPPRSIVAGMPAIIRGSVKERHVEMIERAARNYVSVGKAFREAEDGR